MRSQFEDQLQLLNTSLLEMAALVQDAITKATDALVRQNPQAAQKIIQGDALVDAKEKEIENLCLKLLLHQQPVAKDLRLISSALKMITDLERIGDQAADISELTVYLSQDEYIKKLEHIPQMAKATLKMVTESIDAYVQKDVELARAVIAYDDVVDDLFLCIKRDLIALIHQDERNGEQAMDLIMVAKYFERIGDHATNIAEWAVFSITGKHVEKA